MITNKDPKDPFPDRPGNPSDKSLIQQIIQRRRVAWCALWLTTLVVCILLGGFVFPQTYTSTVSISMQQSSVGNLQALLVGGSSSKYLGVLKSRKFQEEVEDKVHLQQFYHLKTHEDALALIKGATRIDDNATDGLIYVDVTLSAPPRFAAHSEAIREEVRNKAAEAANVFPVALLDYMETSATDKDLVLLRFGEQEVKQTKQHYLNSLSRMMGFVTDKNISAKDAILMSGGSIPTVSPSGASNSPSGAVGSAEIAAAPSLDSQPSSLGVQSGGNGQSSSSVAGSRLATLYLQQNNLELQIHVAQEIRGKLSNILADPVNVVPNMPSEDPLLSSARLKYVQAKQSLDDARLRFGAENPQRVIAEANMKRAEANLRAQAQAMLDGKTTENIRLESLSTSLSEVNGQIKEAERHFSKSRMITAELGRLTNDVSLNLRALETAVTAFEQLKVSTVSARSRLNVVDAAEPSTHPKPGLFSIIAAALAMAFVTVGIWFGIEFTLKKSRIVSPRVNLVTH